MNTSEWSVQACDEEKLQQVIIEKKKQAVALILEINLLEELQFRRSLFRSEENEKTD